MKITQHEQQIANDIDWKLRTGEFKYVPTEGVGFAQWYSRLLTTLTVLIDSDKVVYAQNDYSEGADAVRLVLFTEATVVVVDAVGLAEDPDVTTTAIARRDIVSLNTRSTLRIDEPGSVAYAWPGEVHVDVIYRTLDKPLQLKGAGFVPRSHEELGPIVHLLRSLKRDLARSEG